MKFVVITSSTGPPTGLLKNYKLAVKLVDAETMKGRL